MENYSSIHPLLLSQPPCVEAIKNIHQQKDSHKESNILKKASQDFESILINFTLKAMWETVSKSGLFDEGGEGLDTYTDIMHTALAQDIAAKGGFGIAPVIYKQMMRDKGLTETVQESPSSVKSDEAIPVTRDENESSDINIQKDRKGYDEIAKRIN